MPKPQFDWEVIRQYYVGSGDDVSLGDVATKFGCAYSTVRNRAGKEGWLSDRRQFRAQVRIKTQNRAVTHQAKRRADMLTVADSMKRVAVLSIQRLLAEMTRDPTMRLSVNELRQMFRDAVEIEKTALGIKEGEAMTDDEIDATIADLVAEIDEGAASGSARGSDQD